MARRCFDRGMRDGLADVDGRKIPPDARSGFDRRLRETDWPASAAGEAAFALSPVDLVRHAPVIDQFKQLDRQIVATSVGHKWREVRRAFRNRAVPERIAADWRSASVNASQYVYVMRGLGMTFGGGRDVLNDITLAFLPGAKIGVLGLNGAGKSTLLRIMAGLETGYRGEAWAAESIRVGHLAQEPVLDPSKNVLDNVLEGIAGTRDLLARFEAVSARFAEPLDDEEMNALIEEQGALQERIEAADAWDIDRKVEIAMDALRCPPGEADVATLSGGERRRVALCRLLLGQPDLLLLDEPTNHLDAESVAWLERFLHDYPGTVVAITHDRYFLDNVAGWILELDRGRGIPWKGNYSSWLEQKEKRLAGEEKSESARRRTLARELEWIRATPRARQAKGKARIAAYEALLAEANDRAPETAQIVIPPGPRLGDLVIEARGLTKGYGDRLLMDGLDFRLPPGGIVGVIGANGAGKTTLFRMIAGAEAPDSGALRIGESVVLGHVDQSRDELDPDNSVWGGDRRRRGGGGDGRPQDAFARLCGSVQLPGARSAEKGRTVVRGRAQPGPSRQAAQVGRQRASPRRAHQRPGRRHAPRAGGRAGRRSPDARR